MPSYKNPVFRKAIIPWYKSNSAYIILIVFMLLVLLFALAGISVVNEYPAYHSYVWVPAILLGCSAGIIIIALARLIKRYSRKSVR